MIVETASSHKFFYSTNVLQKAFCCPRCITISNMSVSEIRRVLDFVQSELPFASNSSKRFRSYKEFARLLGFTERQKLPSEIVAAVRHRFPNETKPAYKGFVS